jgi:hypothetical protein
VVVVGGVRRQPLSRRAPQPLPLLELELLLVAQPQEEEEEEEEEEGWRFLKSKAIHILAIRYDSSILKRYCTTALCECGYCAETTASASAATSSLACATTCAKRADFN